MNIVASTKLPPATPPLLHKPSGSHVESTVAVPLSLNQVGKLKLAFVWERTAAQTQDDSSTSI